MKIPQLFQCCKLSHVEGETQITVRSSCCNKPVIFNITYDHEPEDIMRDIVELITPKAPVIQADV